jgi:hypothetical protein
MDREGERGGGKQGGKERETETDIGERDSVKVSALPTRIKSRHDETNGCKNASISKAAGKEEEEAAVVVVGCKNLYREGMKREVGKWHVGWSEEEEWQGQ